MKRGKLNVLLLSGQVNQLFAVIPAHDSRSDCERLDRLAILTELRRDRERDLVGGGTPEENPTLSPSEVEFYYQPTMAKQRKYAALPADTGEGYQIIDAFACLGSRFGLKQLQVFVEVCQSDCGHKPIWANIYYVCDSQSVAAVVEVAQVDLPFDDQWVNDLVKYPE